MVPGAGVGRQDQQSYRAELVNATIQEKRLADALSTQPDKTPVPDWNIEANRSLVTRPYNSFTTFLQSPDHLLRFAASNSR